jgi:hypothetical protein
MVAVLNSLPISTEMGNLPITKEVKIARFSVISTAEKYPYLLS